MEKSFSFQNVAFVIGKSLSQHNRDKVFQLSQKFSERFRSVYVFNDLPISFSASSLVIMVNPSSGFGTILGKNIERGMSSFSVYIFKEDFICYEILRDEMSWIVSCAQNVLIEGEKGEEYTKYFSGMDKIQYSISFEEGVCRLLGDLK